MTRAMIVLCLLSIAGSSFTYRSTEKKARVVNGAISFDEVTRHPDQQQPGKTAKSAAVKKPASKATGKTGGAAASKKDIEQGEQLVGKSDCLACHKVEVKLVGPAYSDVAKKYPSTAANIDLLAQKVIKGGSGVWGAIPMSPHPTVPIEDARNMVKYILSLKSK